MGKLELCFSLLSVQCPGGRSLPRTASLIGTAPKDSGTQAHQSQTIKESPPCGLCIHASFSKASAECRGSVCLWALAGQLEVWGQGTPIGLNRAWGNLQELCELVCTGKVEGECKNDTCQHLCVRKSQQDPAPLADSVRLASVPPSQIA